VRRRAAVAALAAAVLLTGCATRPATRPQAGFAGPLPTAVQLVAAVDARRAQVRALRAWARLRYTAPEESQSAKQLLVAERPDRLRLELFSPFGAVFVLTAADGALSAWDRGEKVVYRGAASAANLRRYTQMDLAVPTAVDLLLGTPPLPAGDGQVSADGAAIRLWQDDDAGVTATWFNAAFEPLRYERHARDGRVLLRVTFDGWAPAGGARLPMQLGIELPPTQRRIEIALTEPEVNPPLAAAAFALATPDGSREIGLDGATP